MADDRLNFAERGVIPERAKILIHGMNFAPEPLGIGRYTAELAAYLVTQNEAVEVITSVPYPGGVPAELRRVDDKMMAMRIRGDKRQQRRRSRSQSRLLLEVDLG